jgi:hypothetical protein
MSFKDFIREGVARKTTKDNLLIKSLVKTSEEDLKFISKLELTEISARKIMSNYYDILRAILEALAILKGYKIYSHEAFTSFLEFIGEKNISEQFDRFRRIRNQINYYGKDISVEEVRENSEKIEILINKIKNKYFKNS